MLCEVTKATLVYCDNVFTVYLAVNPVHHRQAKHIELDIHFVREHVALGRVRVLHVPADQQFADVMTKGLPTLTFEGFRSSLCVTGDASTAGGVEHVYMYVGLGSVCSTCSICLPLYVRVS